MRKSDNWHPLGKVVIVLKVLCYIDVSEGNQVTDEGGEGGRLLTARARNWSTKSNFKNSLASERNIIHIKCICCNLQLLHKCYKLRQMRHMSDLLTFKLRNLGGRSGEFQVF